MKKTFILISILIIMTVIFLGCGPATVGINFSAEAVNQITKDIDMGNGVIVQDYNVTFYKIELGNSEDDKFTLWESTDGEVMNLVDAVDFTDENGAVPGTYEFCRVTIDETINLVGSDNGNSGEADVVVSGNFDMSVPEGQEVFLFGTESAPGDITGDFLLTSPINVQENTELTMIVDISDTVSGDGSGNITLTEPTITFTSTDGTAD
jgi:hypothetical protein